MDPPQKQYNFQSRDVQTSATFSYIFCPVGLKIVGDANS